MKKIYIAIIIIIILIILVIGGFFVFNNFNLEDEENDEIPEDETFVDMLFDDVKMSDKESEAINSLTQRDIMNVSGDGKFYPNDNVSVGEFLKILVRASLSNSNFKDITGDNYLKYVEILEKNKVLNLSEINIDKMITKSEVAILLAKVDIKIKGQDQELTELNCNDLKGLDDVSRTLINHSIARGFVSTDGSGNFNPNINITRAEIASIIYLFING